MAPLRSRSNASLLLDQGVVRYAHGKRDAAINHWQEAQAEDVVESSMRVRMAHAFLDSREHGPRAGGQRGLPLLHVRMRAHVIHFPLRSKASVRIQRVSRDPDAIVDDVRRGQMAAF